MTSFTVNSETLPDLYHAATLGLRDYVNKNGFPGVVLGLSGGIDSALSAAIAVDALGSERVHTLMMPSPYTSQESLDDAAACATALGIQLQNMNIAPAMKAVDTSLDNILPPAQLNDVTLENVQSRLRGLLLMAISNRTGNMVLTTGNKSEMAVGYATLYGDMCGGFSVLKDMYKMEVFALCHWRNSNVTSIGLGPKSQVIPANVISKPPSAELRPDQKDEDSLPPYPMLDAILECFIEQRLGRQAVKNAGYDAAMVERVWGLLKRAEYKRRQAPPGVKLSTMAFGRDWRLPITSKF